MEVLFYSLGVLTVAFLYAVVSVFKLNKKINYLENVVEEHKRQTNIEYNEIYREMDVRINHHATQPLKEINQNVANEVEYLQRTIDSRLDKLETRLTAYVDGLNNNSQDCINDIYRTLENHLTKNS